MPSYRTMSLWLLPDATHLKLQTSYHEAFKAELEQAIPWQDRRWEKSSNEGWMIWILPRYLPELRRLSHWFERAWFYDEVAQQGEDLQTGRTWTLEPPAEQLGLF